MPDEIESAREGRTITVYITNQEWQWLKEQVIAQGQEGTGKQVTLFAKQWAKAGVRIPIKDKLREEYTDALKKLNWQE